MAEPVTAALAITAAAFTIGSAIIDYQNQINNAKNQAYSFAQSAKGIKRQMEKMQALRPFEKKALAREKTELNDSFATSKQLMGLQKQSFELDRLKQRTGEALAKGDTKLARGEATKAARIESEQIRFASAMGGASAFGRAYAQMSVNSLATMDQKLQALQNEGFINKEQFQLGMEEFGLKEDFADRQYGRQSDALSDKTKVSEISFKADMATLAAEERFAEVQSSRAKGASKCKIFCMILTDHAYTSHVITWEQYLKHAEISTIKNDKTLYDGYVRWATKAILIGERYPKFDKLLNWYTKTYVEDIIGEKPSYLGKLFGFINRTVSKLCSYKVTQ